MKGFTFLVAIIMLAMPAMALADEPVSQDRQVAGFDRIEVNGSYDVYLTQGKDFALRIVAEPDVLEKIKTEVKDGRLVISENKHKIQIGVAKKRTRKVYVTLPEIKGLCINGSADVNGQNRITTGSFDLKIRGSGDIDMEVAAKEIEAGISGSGDIKLKGNADDFAITIAGSGDVSAYDLASQKTTVNISGAGDCKVNAEQELTVNITGSGDVSYRGSPKVMMKNVAGAGRVRKE